MGKNVKTKNEILIALDHYYDKQDEATRECLFALKSIMLSADKNIVHLRKYQIPFFRYKEFNLGFLWVHKKKIVVGFVEDKKSFPLEAKPKKDVMTTLALDPMEDIPLDEIKNSIQALIKKYDSLEK